MSPTRVREANFRTLYTRSLLFRCLYDQDAGGDAHKLGSLPGKTPLITEETPVSGVSSAAGACNRRRFDDSILLRKKYRHNLTIARELYSSGTIPNWYNYSRARKEKQAPTACCCTPGSSGRPT